MANIRTIQTAAIICKKARISLCIWGHRGLGKSSIIAQYAEAGVGEVAEFATGKGKKKENVQLPMGFIDLRCSQLEASDLRGLPDKEDGRTVFYPPADMPVGDMTAEEIELQLRGIEDPEEQRVRRAQMQPRYEQGILFLDELNRAQDDVLQAAFQLVLDHRIGQYILPKGWQVVVAGNFMEGYQVNGFTDEAFLDRFCHVILSGGEATLDEWVGYMASKHGPEASAVIEYCSANLKHLDGEIAGELGFGIQPSRRSWDSAARVIKVSKEFPDIDSRAITEVLAGLLGRETATSFQKYNCPVKPLELLKDGVKPHESKMKKLNRNQLLGLTWGVISYAKDKVNTDEKTTDVCLDIAEFLLTSENIRDRDIPVAFCRQLVSGGNNAEQDRANLASITNKKLAELIAKFQPNDNLFLRRLSERPKLQNLLTDVGWGKSEKSA